MDGICTGDVGAPASVTKLVNGGVKQFALSSEVERHLTSRYNRAFNKNTELVYEFTRDPGLLPQY